MGVIIQGYFTSPEGFSYSNFYVRITSIAINTSTPSSFISVSANAYLTRENYKSGSSPLNLTAIPLSFGFNVPTDKIDSTPIISYMYYLVQNSISKSTSIQILCETVLESSQSVFVPTGDLLISSTRMPQTSAENSARLLASFGQPPSSS